MKSFSIPSPIAWAGSGDTRFLKSKELQRTRTGPAQKRAMTLLCFVWGQPRLLKISYLPLILASLEEIYCLLLAIGPVSAQVRIAIAASFAEIWHIAGVSLPSQLSSDSLTPLSSSLPGWGTFQSWTCKPAARQMSWDPPPSLAFPPSMATRRLGEQPGLGRCNPSTPRTKVKVFLHQRPLSGVMAMPVGTPSLLGTNK